MAFEERGFIERPRTFARRIFRHNAYGVIGGRYARSMSKNYNAGSHDYRITSGSAGASSSSSFFMST
jgi:hypothetical protein